MSDSDDAQNIKKYIDERIWDAEKGVAMQLNEISKNQRIILFLLSLLFGGGIGLAIALNRVLNFWN